MPYNFFGFKIYTPSDTETPEQRSPIIPTNDDGAATVYENGNGGFGAFGTTTVDFESASNVINELELINQYRQLGMQPEADEAINDIINELVIRDDDTPPVSLFAKTLPKEYGDKMRQTLIKEFDYVLKLMNFNDQCYEIARQFYVDGRLYYDLVIDNNKPQLGVQELRQIDPRTIRPVRSLKEQFDSNTGVRLVSVADEYFMYNAQGFRAPSHLSLTEGVKITKDRVAYINSGVYTPGYFAVLSHLHKAIKPFNQLRMVEDATVIYRITRAPERRVFYIDIGDLPSHKADAYLQSVATRYRNRMVYDSNTGEIKDDRKIQSMLEDFFLPRRGGTGRGTEIQTLAGGENLGEMADVEYFKRKLYKSLNIPLSRMEPNGGTYTPGRVAEITRDEIKFGRFLSRQRARLSQLFDQIMRRHLTLKGIIRNPSEWDELRKYVRYEFVKDSYFSEMKDLEILNGRLDALMKIEPYIGKHFSSQFVKDKVLRQNPDDQEQIDNDIQENPDDNINTGDLEREQMDAEAERAELEHDMSMKEREANIKHTEAQAKAAAKTKSEAWDLDASVLLETSIAEDAVSEILAENAK